MLSRTELWEKCNLNINQEQNLSVRFSPRSASVWTPSFLQELMGVMYSLWITAGFYLWDFKKKLSPPSLLFIFLHSEWDGSYHTVNTTLPLYTDGVLFLCIKPKIAVSSEDLMTQLSGFCSRYSNRTGEPTLTVPGGVQDADLKTFTCTSCSVRSTKTKTYM